MMRLAAEDRGDKLAAKAWGYLYLRYKMRSYAQMYGKRYPQ